MQRVVGFVSGGKVPARILVLFSLAEGQDVDEYRRWSGQRIHPGMKANRSVIAFDDYALVTVAGSSAGYDYCEIIDATGHPDFDAENRSGPGLELSNEWRSRMARFAVLHLDPLVDAAI